MRHKKMIAAFLSICLIASAQITSFADTVIEGDDSNGVGPGFEMAVPSDDASSQPDDVFPMAWKWSDGAYRDDTGAAIEGALLRGISVSKWQGAVDWGMAAADDVSFALIRMGSFGYEGEYTMDEMFDRNMREAKANGVHTTPYVYLQTRTVEEARQAAQYTMEIAKNYEIAYPIAADIESQYIMDLSVQELTDIVNAFCQVLAENGYTPIVYSDYYKFTNEMDTNQIPYDIWLARYGGDHNYPNRTMWQATDKGSVAGIEGNVCIEFAFKDYAPQPEQNAENGQNEENGQTADNGQTAENGQNMEYGPGTVNVPAA